MIGSAGALWSTDLCGELAGGELVGGDFVGWPEPQRLAGTGIQRNPEEFRGITRNPE